jgi:hypothetical protein
MFRRIVVGYLLLPVLAAAVARAQSKPDQSPANQTRKEVTQPALKNDSRFDLGLTATGLAGPAGGPSGNAGLGVRASYFLVKRERAIALDAQVSQLFASTAPTLRRGGQATEGLFGVKFQFNTDSNLGDPRKYNGFIKVRPGFIRWSNAVVGLTAAPAGSAGSFVPARTGPSTNLAIDFGISLEGLIESGWWWRVDLGDTAVYYQGMNVAGTSTRVPGTTKNNFQIDGGVFYRF